MKYTYSTGIWDEQGNYIDLYDTVEMTEDQEREKRLEKRTVTMVMRPCRGGVDDTLTITSLEGFAPNFEYTGEDLPRLLRRLDLVKRDIDRFIAQHETVQPAN